VSQRAKVSEVQKHGQVPYKLTSKVSGNCIHKDLLSPSFRSQLQQTNETHYLLIHLELPRYLRKKSNTPLV
jgi:hypothetical protein